ncbi:hypothetical protein CHARACLAT_006545 [Characodon lateralis]|uniref:Uncharacterized protein n=2 Tax=Goodeidae TaxID=28758 RepID=A0ABU7BWH8_9TELE|nr:hypothetical protein [Ataeniobius toweri]MED6276792.1 hypothetical protein [Characodon lateralis]
MRAPASEWSGNRKRRQGGKERRQRRGSGETRWRGVKEREEKGEKRAAWTKDPKEKKNQESSQLFKGI